MRPSPRVRSARLSIGLHSISVIIMVCAFGLGAPMSASAADPSAAVGLVPVEGICTFGVLGTSATAQFSPALTALSGGLTGVSGTGSCVTSAGLMSMGFNIGLASTWTCGGGEGAGSGSAGWSAALPADSQVTSVTTGGPGSIHIHMQDLVTRFVAEGDFAWSAATDVAECPVRHLSSEQLIGQLTFVSG